MASLSNVYPPPFSKRQSLLPSVLDAYEWKVMPPPAPTTPPVDHPLSGRHNPPRRMSESSKQHSSKHTQRLTIKTTMLHYDASPTYTHFCPERQLLFDPHQ